MDDVAVMVGLALRLMPLLLMEKNESMPPRKLADSLPAATECCRPDEFSFVFDFKIAAGHFPESVTISPAMEARNYRRGGRSSFVELKFSAADYVVLVFLQFFGYLWH